MKYLLKTITALTVLTFNTLTAQSNNSIPVTVVNEAGNTSLKWSTILETNSSHFVIEISIDNKNFNTIGNVKAAGYSLSKLNYELEFADRSSANLFYRITLVNADDIGKTHEIVCAKANPLLPLTTNK